MQRTVASCVVVLLLIGVAAFADEVPAARGVSPAQSRAFLGRSSRSCRGLQRGKNAKQSSDTKPEKSAAVLQT
mgnify:CR=1 FL=1